MITLEQFSQMIPSNKNPKIWYDAAVSLFEKYDITTTNRMSGFMAQGAHESGDFKTLEENLNYSAVGLRKTFGKYFPTDALAKQYAKKPEMIANRVYDDALRTNKLGNTKPGDGWKFRGGGIFQLTGRNNYDAFGKTVGMNADEAVAYVRTTKGAMESALWFWSVRNLNKTADANNIKEMSVKVNGGENGLADRIEKYNRNVKILKAVPVSKVETPVATIPFVSIKRKDQGVNVKKIQTALKIGADGIFGFTTDGAVRSWQRLNNFPVSGIIDEEQFKKLTGEK